MHTVTVVARTLLLLLAYHASSPRRELGTAVIYSCADAALTSTEVSLRGVMAVPPSGSSNTSAAAASGVEQQRAVLKKAACKELAKDRVRLCWTIDFANEALHVELTCDTLGWCAFGLSEWGTMYGADIVMVRKRVSGDDERKVAPDFEAVDMWAASPILPSSDETQDWILQSAWRDSSNTIARMSRALDTCDPADITVATEYAQYVVWAMGSSDDIEYHSDRGTSEIDFVNDLKLETSALLENSIERKRDTYDSHLDFVIDEVSFLNNKGPPYYYCRTWSLKDVLEQYQLDAKTSPKIVAWEMWPPSNFLHHSWLFKCSAGTYKEASDASFYCIDPPMRCSPIAQTVSGIGMQEMPDEAYASLMLSSDGEDATTLLIQNHYEPTNGETQAVGFGLRMYYNAAGNGGVQRKYESGVLLVAPDFPSLQIPPGMKEYAVQSGISPECTSLRLQPEGINIFITRIHMHLHGVRGDSYLYRDGKFMQRIHEWKGFDPFIQPPLRKRWSMLPGDGLKFTCVYDTTNEQQTTYGRLTLDGEMCLLIMQYYPRQPEFDNIVSRALRPVGGPIGTQFCGSQGELVTFPGLSMESMSIASLDWALRLPFIRPWYLRVMTNRSGLQSTTMLPEPSLKQLLPEKCQRVL